MKFTFAAQICALLLATACASSDDARSQAAAHAIATSRAEARATAAVTVTPARIIERGDPSRRAVALTFDAELDAGHTEAILTTLRRERIRATFGVQGKWAEDHSDLLLAIAADGHQIINHGYNHLSFTGASTERDPLTAEQRSSELTRTETTITVLTGRSTRPYFRPPYGDVDAGVQLDAAIDGYGVIVLWSVDTLGWEGASEDEIVARALEGAEPGAIYVMHVWQDSREAAALQRIIDGLRAQGYGFATIEDIDAGR